MATSNVTAVNGAQSESKKVVVFNPFEDLTPRQKIALASKWGMLKQGERDTLAEFAAKGYDAATLFALYSMRNDADSKIFSDNRAGYITKINQWMPSINSSDKAIKDFAEKELATVGTETNAAQQLTLLSAVKALLLRGKTFLPEKEEKDFRAVCRLYGYDLSAVK